MRRRKGKFAIILSGCGCKDGSEVREVVLSMLYLEKMGMPYKCFAPDIMQHDVVNHINGKQMAEQRNMLVESARIAGGNVEDIAQLEPEQYDVLLMTGGAGWSKSLSDFGSKTIDCQINEDLKRVILGFKAKAKPIGAFNISAAILLKAILGKSRGRPKLTIGDDSEDIVHSLGGIHEYALSDVYIFDIFNNLVTCPALSNGNERLDKVAKGIEKSIKRLSLRIRRR